MKTVKARIKEMKEVQINGKTPQVHGLEDKLLRCKYYLNDHIVNAILFKIPIVFFA